MKNHIRHWMGVLSILALILSWAVIGPAQPGAAAPGDVIADVLVPEPQGLAQRPKHPRRINHGAANQCRTCPDSA